MGSLLFFLRLMIFAFTVQQVAVAEVNPNENLIQQALDRKLDQDQQWTNLLHFKTTMLGFYESQVDGHNFFLSPKGDSDPKAELIATLESFLKPWDGQAETEISICRFPARWMWAKKNIPELGKLVKEPTCEKFQKFFTALRGISVSLVFSSYYLNNPSSAFGHTFLRINKAPANNGKRYELLDYGLNYAAMMTSGNPIVYSFQGIFGLMPGVFTSVPYYYKVREYNNAESRDLWEYELKVDAEAVDFLVAHSWELGPVSINYWYLTENCSYHMLTLLDAADPKLNLAARTKKYIVPADTVKVAWDAGLVGKTVFRPSIRTEFFTRFSRLSESEKSLVQKIVEEKVISDELTNSPAERQVEMLDASVDGIEYLHPQDVQKENSSAFLFKNKLLQLRSRLDLKSPPISFSPLPNEEPHLSHGSRRVGAGYLNRFSQEPLALFRYKYSINDLLDPIGGYPEYAKITFFDFLFSYGERSHKVFLEDLTMFEVMSMVPWEQFNRIPSWGLKLGIERFQNEACLNCHVGVISGSVGLSIANSTEPRITAFAGIHTEVDYSNRGPGPRWYLGFGPEARVRARWTPTIVSLLEFKSRVDMNTEQRFANLVKFSSQWSFEKQQGLRINIYDQWFDRGGGVEWVYYH